MTELCITATPTFNSSPQRLADFATLAEALDYAAEGCTGFNFHDNRGRLLAPLAYVEVRRRALDAARRLKSLGLERGARVAVIADTDPAFMEIFFGCQYAGLVPVPMPIPMSIGGHERYVARLDRLVESCEARVAIAPTHMVRYIEEMPSVDTLAFHGDIEAFRTLPVEEGMTLAPSGPDEIAYLQYTSGSTGFPRGVEIRQHAIMANLRAILASGLAVRPQDRCVSWLPFYHDMGLVGFVLGPMASQLSVDYLGPREFAMRPRLWLSLMTRNRGSIAFAPPFGYDLCTRRLHGSDIDRLDLSAWRVAGVGAEPVLPDVLERFADHFAAAGFDRRAFLPSYGMAENSLAVSFAPLGTGMSLDHVNRDALEQHGEARALDDPEAAEVNATSFVNCGHPLPGHDIIIRDSEGQPLPERHVGRVTIRGPSLMSGYFRDPEQTRKSLGDDGWFDTGDLGYLTSQGLHVTGRHKDLIIVNGRNIWPQDIEALASRLAGINRGELTALAPPEEAPEVDVVVLVQTTLSDEQERAALVKEMAAGIRSEFGIRCTVSLLPPRTLPRTSSGKISRSQARRQYAAQLREAMGAAPTPSAAASS
ncbi:fatty-acyl-CoA synthase [Kushneria sinocarnis]|uniref:Fatty-acyl-CoA synthase n=1 Tax=Kushneria sinocarnis TaxID=595502 RepID=A0A420X013_9GAMM|nr:fatty acyl-AMP ligase [Kushneria sinocarnis]RKR06946.1 fatty-acyl-CoA synthase [Kushneria sinocarnis]